MGSTESDQFFLFRFNILVLLILQYCSITNTAQPKYFPTYIYHFCLGGNYSTTTERTYRNNLDNLLSSLSSLQFSLVISNGYYYNHYGENPDTVYGAGQCNCDSRSRTCKDCVDTAAKDIIGSDRCPNSKGAIIWYDECMLRYSNESFFSIMQENPSVHLGNTANIKNPDLFIRILGGLMDNLTKEAVSSTGSSDTSLFAIGETMFTEFQKIYGLVQCTFDLSHNSCNRCLLRAIAQLLTYCGGKQGGRVMQPSCYCRYEIYPFFQSTVPQAAPALLPDPKPPSTNYTTTKLKGKNSSKLVVSIVVPSVIAVLLTIGIWCFCLWRKKAMKRDDLVDIESAESLQFNFSTIRAATDNFCFANKLGEGGFGTVYMGTLSDGQEIAVKRLSRNSGQGDEEFKNEVALVVKLQHRNLVRLLGFCLHGQERLLIYEFMPNASLDQFLFDPIKRSYLDWERRYTIVGGIARGLLYLHEDSRLRIVHRDLKASNVLLGADMNPKISDFGMARMFIMYQTQANTDRIVGTYGYMAPEYAMHGHFSVKSDVFSFGVLVLEILSGRKNNSFYGSEGAQDLLSYAWEHWKEGTTVEFLDSTLRKHHSRIEVMRCIHIGLLCVQENISNRPTMASIVNMLNNNSVNLKTPSSPPAFFVNSRKERSGHSASGESSVTVDEASITELHPR